jgi:membrane protease YdiL (CAAX protease family)
LVGKHQVIAFFTLTLGMNFLLGIPGIVLVSLSQPFLRIVGFYLLRIAIFSPVMSGIFITWLSDIRREGGRRAARWIIFGAVGVLAWIVGALQMKSTMPPQGGLSILSIILLNGPLALLPAYVFSRALSSSLGLRKYLITLIKPRGHIAWYIIALVTFPVIHILGNLIMHILGGQSFGTQGFSLNLMWIAVITFLSVFFFTGGINEESGWRGFALLKLQGRFSPILAGLIIWSCHAVWELNGDIFMSLFMGGQVSWPVLSRLVWMPSWTILFIWVYNRTKGSILAPAIFHASMNMMNPLMGVLPATNAGTILLILFALFAVFYDRMWKKIPGDDLLVSHEP